MANAKPEIPCEVSSRGTKRESSEDYDSDDFEDSDYSIDWDSDDPAFEILEGKPDRKIWMQYLKEWDESEGFDITVHPGTSSMAGIEPLQHHLTNPKRKQEYTELCKLAIDDFNSKNDDNKKYTFKELVTVNASHAAGTWYYLTFKARDTTVDADSDADALKSFQALVWNGIDKTISVHFCRLKKFVTNEGKKKKKKKIQQDGKAKVEQVEPRFLKGYDPELVIEELCKGKPRGKKAFAGYKIGVRYTCKLMENDEVFDTNVGKDPLEFRIASGQVVRGWEYGVIGMRVGDRRRITIPPHLGYGAKGHLDVVPPDSWLIIEVELIYVK